MKYQTMMTLLVALSIIVIYWVNRKKLNVRKD